MTGANGERKHRYDDHQHHHRRNSSASRRLLAAAEAGQRGEAAATSWAIATVTVQEEDVTARRLHTLNARPEEIELLQKLSPSSKAAAAPAPGDSSRGGGPGGGMPTAAVAAVVAVGERPPTPLEQAAAAMFYAVASLLVIFVNKEVLTARAFPSFMFIAISQCTATCVVVSVMRITKLIKLASFKREIAPLMAMFVLNTLCGLGGTQHINLPMFTVLRRFSILMTMLLERMVLKTNPSVTIQVSVAMMIAGALVAALYDLQYELMGYLLILGNDFFTAAYGISIKRTLNLQIPQMSLLYYNSLFGATALTLAVLVIPGESDRIVSFKGWRDPSFLALYLCTSFMGSVLQYSIFVCTRVNSALTTAVVGCMKNLLTTLVGMVGLGGDYHYELKNCVGLAISMAGSFLYSWAKVTKR